MRDVDFSLNPYFVRAIASTAHTLVLYGGSDSGKSWTAAQKCLARIIDGPERFLVLRKVARTIKHSTFQTVLDIIAKHDLESRFKINRSDFSIECPHSGGSIWHAGIDDPQKLKSIQGITSIWIEEPTELELNDWLEVVRRMRNRVTYNQIMLTFNPVDEFAWPKEHFNLPDHPPDEPWIERDRFAALHTTIRHNPWADVERRRVLEEMPAGFHRDVYLLGLWGGIPEGLIWPHWREKPFPENVDDRCYGLDFGFVKPASLVEVALKDGVEIYAREWIHATGLTNADLIMEMNDLKIDKNVPIFADHEADRITEIERAGYLIYPANKEVLSGLDSVRGRRLYLTPNSVNLKKEIRGYTRDKDRHGNLIEKPLKQKDHGMDAIRYAVHTRWGVPEPAEIATADVAL